MDYKGLKTGGRAGHTEEKREKEWISRGYKQGAGRANLRKKEKMNGYWGLKTRGSESQLRKKEKTNGLVWAKKQRVGWPT